MSKQYTNGYGLTFRQWYLAAGFASKPDRLIYRHHWLDGVDPSEIRAEREQAQRSDKLYSY